MLLVSWNVAGRARRVREQGELLLALEPDVVCLQEDRGEQIAEHVLRFLQASA